MVWRRGTISMLVAILAGLTVWAFWPCSVYSGLVYATVEGTRLTLDLDLPSTARESPARIILFAPPDGEWPREFKQEEHCRMLLERLTEHGYAVATVHYHLPGKRPFPAQVEDGKAAVRWLRANASAYGLDGRSIGVVGVSSGAWGACMLGTTGGLDDFEGCGGNADQSSRVQAVVGMGVPADFGVRTWSGAVESYYLRPLLGAPYWRNPQLYERASPGAYATADGSPFLLFHSTEDLLVPVEMPRRFAERLRRAGESVELVEAPGWEHIWENAKLEQAMGQMLAFFDRHLR